jgi:hypothetical protein
MGEAANGSSPYLAFTETTTIDFTGWQLIERNVLTDPVAGWVIPGDGALNSTCSFSGLMFRQPASGGSASTTTYYVDDIAFKAASGVSDWSVY